MSLFACGELVRRGRRTLRIFHEFVRFQPATIEDGSPVPNITEPVFPERRGRRSLRGICIDIKRANTVRPYRVANDFCGFIEKTAIN